MFRLSVILFGLALLILFPGNASAGLARSSSIAFIIDTVEPVGFRWRDSFEREIRIKTDGEYSRIREIQTNSASRSAIAKTIKELKFSQANVIVVAAAFQFARELAVTYGNPDAIFITLDTVEKSELTFLQSKLNGRFFAFQNLSNDYVDMISAVIEGGFSFEATISLIAEWELLRQIEERVKIPRKTQVFDPGRQSWEEIIERSAGSFYAGKQVNENLILAFDRNSTESFRIIERFEKFGLRDQSIMFFVGPTLETRGRVAAQYLSVVLNRMNPDNWEVNRAVDILRRSEFFNRRTLSIDVPWGITATRTNISEFLIEKFLWGSKTRAIKPDTFSLCRTKNTNNLIVSYEACPSLVE